MINAWMAAEERRSATRREEPRRDVTRFIVKRGLDLARVYEDCKGGGGRRINRACHEIFLRLVGGARIATRIP